MKITLKYNGMFGTWNRILKQDNPDSLIFQSGYKHSDLMAWNRINRPFAKRFIKWL